jgi:hypothetical protein
MSGVAGEARELVALKPVDLTQCHSAKIVPRGGLFRVRVPDDTRNIVAALGILFFVFVAFAAVTSYRHITHRPAVTISQVR